mmetsp:Transcript_18701/g.44365  ORF Transcript_18701/g.44365 Transcript_18701/m.44365 type:complete len:205 (+) Transcript_18701:1047-1661(+)
MKNGLPLLRLKNALVAHLRQSGPEPVIKGVLLHLLQGDDVGGHRLQLLDDEVLAPIPGERPLLAVGVHILSRIEVCQNVPVHHLELLAEPLRVEGPAIADHLSHSCLLRRGDHCACGDGHHARHALPAVLGQGDDVHAQGPVNVQMAGAVLPGLGHLGPLCQRLLEAGVVGLFAPVVSRQMVPAPQEALPGAVVIKGLGHIPDL